MKITITTTILIAAAAVMLLGGCASDSTHRPKELSASDTCAPNETLVCEVSNTGRIKHGSFSKEGKRCSCSDARSTGPIIPDIQ